MLWIEADVGCHHEAARRRWLEFANQRDNDTNELLGRFLAVIDVVIVFVRPAGRITQTKRLHQHRH